ncbi:ABC transporter substrate-binding protein [Streptomyces longispororuber]|uniref:ABC transporter substrate-binding protein n=1 Tax=Streptomyces longispororuber TaxID=68230 RepID=UPI00210D240A|nr:ABC transporter substrate-binding protein [Streptomyces longispororuber]MCQ4207010.1 ABC transporter substrate-binding protein [Streptomyces longispororuber]
MTGWRHTTRTIKHSFRYAAVVTGAALVTGCGLVPGATGGSGDQPVKVMTWAPEKTEATNMPGMPAMAKAYARWVNAHGGIGGRRLEVLTCNDHNDSVDAAKCARSAVEQNVVAVVGSYSQHGRAFLSPLESAGIPYIGGYGATDAEFRSPLSYPVNGGQAALLAGNGQQLAEHCDRTVLVRPDTIAGDELGPLLDTGLALRDRRAATDLRAAEDATDYGGQARQALSTASSDPLGDGCVAAVLGDRTDTFFDSFRRLRDDYPSVRTATVLGSVDQSVIDRSGGAKSPYEGAYVTGWYPAADDARWNAMRKAINEQAFDDNRIDPADAGVQTTWIAYSVLKQVVESLGDGEVTSRSVRKALDGGVKVTTGGLTPALHWGYDHMSSAGDFPRLVNARVAFQKVEGGRLVATRRSLVDVTATLAKAP